MSALTIIKKQLLKKAAINSAQYLFARGSNA